MIISVPENLILYRYDINKPPVDWDSTKHITEYTNHLNRGKKNKEGFYFLYDNYETTKSTAKTACFKFAKNEYWLTTTNTTKQISIIDFSKCKCLHDMLDIIDTLNIKIYDSLITINGFEAIWNISDLRNHNRLTRVITKVSELTEVSWFGQLLTDFDNGKKFKKLIQDANLDIDGYRWCEAYNPYGLTYCFLNNGKLSTPYPDTLKP